MENWPLLDQHKRSLAQSGRSILRSGHRKHPFVEEHFRLGVRHQVGVRAIARSSSRYCGHAIRAYTQHRGLTNRYVKGEPPVTPRQLTENGTQQSRRNGLVTSNAQFAGRRVGQELQLAHAHAYVHLIINYCY